MDIYKLSDDVLGEVSSHVDKNTITDLKQGVNNPNRVNVFVNGKFVFSLDVAQVVDFKLKVGQVLSEERLAELKKASDFGKLYQRTLEWVLIRPRSEKEVRDYLYRKFKTSSSDTLLRARRYGAQSLTPLPVGRGMSSDDVFELSSEIMKKLISRCYVDDRKFAEWWVENRNVRKGVSQKKLKMELINKGVAKDIIEEVLVGRDDEEEILKIIAKKRAKYDDEKLISYLCRQGFLYELAKEKVQSYEKD